MIKFKFKQTLTYRVFKLFSKHINELIETLGEFGIYFYKFFLSFLKLDINLKKTLEECARFAFDSLPITLSIVGMTSVILSMQIAPEMVKQGGGEYVGMLVAAVMIREIGVIMSGFAIISMIGSSFASEIATMRVTDQIDAIEVLHVDPLNYLFSPKILAGTIMMPLVVIVATAFGILCAGIVSKITADVSFLSFKTSVWQGLIMKDIWVCLLKSIVFGFLITLISSTCGYIAKGGAKGVGEATTKAVVASFITIVIVDYLFALFFYL